MFPDFPTVGHCDSQLKYGTPSTLVSAPNSNFIALYPSLPRPRTPRHIAASVLIRLCVKLTSPHSVTKLALLDWSHTACSWQVHRLLRDAHQTQYILLCTLGRTATRVATIQSMGGSADRLTSSTKIRKRGREIPVAGEELRDSFEDVTHMHAWVLTPSARPFKQNKENQNLWICRCRRLIFWPIEAYLESRE